MTINRNPFNNRRNNPAGFITAVVIGLTVLVVLFFLARFIFNILYYLSPLFLIATLFFDRTVIVNYLKWIRNLYRKDLVIGVGATILSVFGFPILSTFLLGKALFKRQVREVAKRSQTFREGKLIDYEVIDEEPLDLSRLEEQNQKRAEQTKERPQRKPDSDQAYEDLFE